MQRLSRVDELVLAVLVFAFVVPAGAQQMPVTIVNPPGASLTLALRSPGPFNEMQIIHGTVEFQQPSSSAHDELDHPIWSFAGYLVDPPLRQPDHACGTVENLCSRYLGLMLDQNHYWMTDDPNADKPKSIRITDRLPDLAPGNYRIAAVVERQHRIRATDPSQSSQVPRRSVVVSNWQPLTIVPATDAWINEVLSAYGPTLDPPDPIQEPEAHRVWQDKIHQIQMIDHPAAWQIMATSTFGRMKLSPNSIVHSRHPQRACAWMRDRISDPSVRVDSSYVHAQLQICARVELPPNAVTDLPHASSEVDAQAAALASMEQRSRWRQQEINIHGARLLASLPKREGEVLTAALAALLEWIPSLEEQRQAAQTGATASRQTGMGWSNQSAFSRIRGPQRTPPSWAAALQAELPRLVAALPPLDRSAMLSRLAHQFESPEWVRPIEDELRQVDPGAISSNTFQLIHSLADLAPDRAASLIADELRKSRTWLQPAMLTLLPSDPRPFADEELVEWLMERPADSFEGSVWEVAVGRFASPEAAPKLREIFEQRLPACQPALIGYFVRNDPDYAAKVLQSHLHLQKPGDHCQSFRLSRVASYGMGPVLEEFLTAHLFHSLVPLKRTAAETLRDFGSPAAQAPIWKALEHFHQYWKGREDQLNGNPEGGYFEMSLVGALTRAKSWILTAAQLERLRTLCITKTCLIQADELAKYWQHPVQVSVMRSGRRWQGSVAYHHISSKEELLERLRQLPAGTHLRIHVQGSDGNELRNTILSEASAAGLVTD